jgi:transposase
MREKGFGRSRGRFTCWVRCVGDPLGRPLDFQLTDGEAADCHSYDALGTLPFHASGALITNMGYDSDAIRVDLVARGITPVTSGRRNRKQPVRSSKTLYRLRYGTERTFGRLKIYRALTNRYDRLASGFLGMFHFASIVFWLRSVDTA